MQSKGVRGLTIGIVAALALLPGCFDVLQRVTFHSDGSATVSVRITLPKGKKPGAKEPIKQSDLRKLFGPLGSSKFTVSSVDDSIYQGVQADGRIAAADFPAAAEVESRQVLVPIRDGRDQFVFVYFNPKKAPPRKKDKSDEMALAVLGAQKFRIFFSGAFRPKSAELRPLGDEPVVKLELIPFGDSVFVEFPVSVLATGALVTVSQGASVRPTLSNELAGRLRAKQAELIRAREQKDSERKRDERRPSSKETEATKDEPRRAPEVNFPSGP